MRQDNENVQALDDLLDELARRQCNVLAHRRYNVTVELPQLAPHRHVNPSINSIGIFLPYIATDQVRDAVIKQLYDGTKRWLRKRFTEHPGTGAIHVTLWGPDATTHKVLRATSADHIEDVTPPRPIAPTVTAIKLVGLWDTFNDFTLPTQIFFIASFVFGLAMLFTLWATDVGIDVLRPDWLLPYNADWLHHHSYIPNVLAGATGFLIGAPFALIVLATFTVQREERAALERVNKLSALAWGKFRDSVFDLCNQKRMYTGLTHDAYLSRELHDQIFKEYQRRIGLAQTPIHEEKRFHGISDDEIAGFKEYLRDRSDLMGQYMSDALETLGAQYQLQIRWSIIRTNWNTLNQYVRLQRLERSLPWFKDELDAQFMDRLSDRQHPLTTFMRLHTLETDASTASMSAALAMIKRDIDRPVDELRAKLMAGYTAYGSSQIVGGQYMSEFGFGKVAGHQEASHDAQEALIALRRVVDDVEKDRWPGNFTRPVVPD
jgi:hypothetical protein